MLSMFSGGAGTGSSAEDDADLEEDRDRLRDFQFKMIELQVPCLEPCDSVSHDFFHHPGRSRF